MGLRLGRVRKHGSWWALWTFYPCSLGGVVAVGGPGGIVYYRRPYRCGFEHFSVKNIRSVTKQQNVTSEWTEKRP